jgi:3-oxoacyl-[acyl-carrier-protein] synthase II
MLAGGVDALSGFVVSGFGILRALASTEVRPFDRRRDGLALGEGAAIVVLEEAGSARRRGAPILAELLGAGTALDAHHMTGPSPDGDGVVRAVTAALSDAGAVAASVDFISAHGTGTSFNDRMETVAFKRLFAGRAARIPIDSVKPIIGHTLGAAGALEAIVCARVLGEGIVPPTINYREPDPECDLDYVPNEARRVAVRCALSTSSGFAGHNAALLFGAP